MPFLKQFKGKNYLEEYHDDKELPPLYQDKIDSLMPQVDHKLDLPFWKRWWALLKRYFRG